MAFSDGEWCEELGRAAEAIGSGAFHDRLLRAFCALAPHDIATVVRYARFSEPDFLIHQDFSEAMIARYLATYYQYDPFYRYWREQERPGVVALKDFASNQLKQGRYVRDFLRESCISDELGVFLPAIGRSSIAMFLERAKGRFTGHEIARINRTYPVLAGLHRAHVNSTFAALGDSAPFGMARRPTLIADRGGGKVYANEAWNKRAEGDPEIARALAALGTDDGAEVALPGDRVLHAEPLGNDFFLAPGGRIFTLEDVGHSPATISPQQAVELYRDVLTPRECEVVALILEGHPTFTIAKRLGLSVGTVKNHRRRIYGKLDITTERELFLLYIEAFSRRNAIG